MTTTTKIAAPVATTPTAKAYPKRTCPTTLAAFLAAAQPLSPAVFGGLAASPTVFSTGSWGYRVTSKVDVVVGTSVLTVQVGGNIVVVGSKGSTPQELPPTTLAAILGDSIAATPKVFSTGSFGWGLCCKAQGDSLQVGLNMTVVGSKDAPRS